MLCGHDPSQAEADHDQRPAANTLWPDHPVHALALFKRDPGEKHGMDQQAWTEWGDESSVHYVPTQKTAAAPRKPMAEAGGLRKQTSVSAPLMQLSAGECVSHDAFGKGMVLSVRPMGNDALIEVAFDKVGTKKLMLKAAGSHLKKQ